jgi:hypothetical protein
LARSEFSSIYSPVIFFHFSLLFSCFVNIAKIDVDLLWPFVFCVCRIFAKFQIVVLGTTAMAMAFAIQPKVDACVTLGIWVPTAKTVSLLKLEFLLLRWLSQRALTHLLHIKHKHSRLVNFVVNSGGVNTKPPKAP